MGRRSWMTRARPRRVLALAVLVTCAGAIAGCSSGGRASRTSTSPTSADHPKTKIDDDVRLNQIQVIGSHNSYHQLLAPSETRLSRQVAGRGNGSSDYRHAPLAEQLESQKLRELELDVWLDSKGGRFATPLLRAATHGGPTDPVMREPGIKVFHVQDTDYHSSCLTLQICLRQIKGWSDAHPTHVPVAVLIELKDGVPSLGNIKFAAPERWTAPSMSTLDAEIRRVFRPDEIITPDDVRGSRPTLLDAVLHHGWPTLAQSRGKVLFLMDNANQRTAYLQGHPGLAGRVLFTNSIPGQPDAAFIERNDPKKSQADIRSLVRQGYMVRTMADHETREARSDDTSSRDAALASGAQWVSTDYPVPNYGVGFATKYVVQLPGATVARCDPVNRPADCSTPDLDTVFTPPAPTSIPPTTTG